MKVVCVTDEELFAAAPGEVVAVNGNPVVGEVYTVVGRFTTDEGVESFELEEKPVTGGGWEARLFVPLDYFQAEFAVSEEKVEPKQVIDEVTK